jgi:excinuclease ABC subunit C
LAVEYACPTFVKLTCTDPFPRLLLTREFAADGSQYLGPFPRFDMAEVVLAALQRLTPLRICEGPIVPGVSPRPCEAFYVKKCVAPCTGSESASGYPAAVEAVLALLQGGRKALLQRLAQDRERAAAALQFERARHLHALLTGLDAVTVGRPLALVPVASRNLVVRLRRDASLDDVFCVRHGLLREQLSVQGSGLDRERLRAALARCYFAEAPGSSLGGQAVVDELRIVGGWLHRTAHRARWVSITPRMSLEEALEGVCQLRGYPESRSEPYCHSEQSEESLLVVDT